MSRADSCHNGEKMGTKQIIVVGRIGNTEYQNNDRCKVISIRGGRKTVYAGACHGNIPMVVRIWKRNA